MKAKPCYEAGIAPAIARALADGKSVGEIEVDGIFFEFEVKQQPDEEETAYTGVTFMGSRESYIRTTHRACIKYIGAYELCRPPYWVKDPCADDARELDIALDMNLLAKCIEEQDNDSDRYIISIAA